MKFNIAFYCESIPFMIETIRLETSLGGSESALIGMAENLAAIGHDVTVFTQIDDPQDRQLVNGVQWYDSRDEMPRLLESVEWDVFISLRMPSIFASNQVRAKYKAIWTQDELMEPNQFLSQIWSVDEIYYVSDWQRRHYESQLPETVQKMAFVTKNGIDLQRIDKAIEGVEKIPNQLIYISRPERGLEPLLQIFPKIKAAIPDATLKVCRYYSMYEPNPNVKMICEWADRAIEETEGVEYLGNLNKEQLYHAIAESELMVYPGVPNFNETSCIAALEAQACRTPLICSKKGALVETNDGGIWLDGDAFDSSYQTRFANVVTSFLTGQNTTMQKRIAKGRQWVEENYQFSQITQEWDAHLHDFFETRLTENVQAIYKQLIQYDDINAARRLAKRFDFAAKHSAIESYRDETETPEAYSTYALAPQHEINSGRLGAALDLIKTIPNSPASFEPRRILDFACGNGSMAGRLCREFPDAEIVCVDYSQELCDTTTRYLSEMPNKVDVRCGSIATINPTEVFDLIFCGEYLEHHKDPEDFVEQLESHLTDDGWLVWTVPHGPQVEFFIKPGMYGHKTHFELNTINELFGKKKNFTAIWFTYYYTTPRGNPTGHWLIKHQKGETGEIDWVKKYTLTRPYQSLSLCMITKNEEDNLSKCLKSVHQLADEIIIADMESDDNTVNIAKRYNATIKPLPKLCPDVPPNTPPPGSFEWARNESVKGAKGDWILWLDADEEILGGHALRKYLESRCFDGFVLRQNHLELDAPNHYDTPVRLYRNTPQFRFYGVIHEHAMKSLNKPIEPALELSDCQIIHYGYVTEGRRRVKCETRNMHLLRLDREQYPDRHLGQVLLAREYLNFIHWDLTDGKAALVKGGYLHPRCAKQRDYAERIIAIIDKFNTDWTPTLCKLAWPLYQEALKLLGIGRQTQIVNNNEVETVRYRDISELDAYLREFEDE